ncbi:MAG: hypothetical protein H7067_17665 [Burkholderiales bacterium]|nr:hypothetical protein [Opitutaceae bacterium]
MIIFLIASCTDADAPEVSDLALEAIEVEDEENFYLLLARRGDELAVEPIISTHEVDEPVSESDDTQPAGGGFAGYGYGDSDTLRERLGRGEAWTPERLARWGGALDALAVECDALVRIEKAQGTVPDEASGPNTAGDLREVANHLRLAVWARFHAGRQDEAVASAFVGLAFGRKLTDARGTLIDYLSGDAVRKMFCGTLQQLAAHPEITTASLRRIQAGLTQAGNGVDGYAHSLRNETMTMYAYMSGLDAEKAAGGGMTGGDELRVFAATRVLFPLVYKRNKTAATYVDIMRHEIEVHDLALGVRPTPSDVLPEWRGIGEFIRPWNLQGRMMLRILVPTISKVSGARHLGFSRQSATEAFVALRRYHQEHGKLPESLDALIPAYLATVPLDYVDRRPIRYSREARAVWSVGYENLEITTPEQSVHTYATAYRLDFAAPADAAGSDAVVPRPE